MEFGLIVLSVLLPLARGLVFTGDFSLVLLAFPCKAQSVPADVAALAVHIMTNALTRATYDIDGGQQLVAAWLERQTLVFSESDFRFQGTYKEEKMATSNAISSHEPTSGTSAARLDMKFEIVVIPVSDVDRAKEFYARLGWRLDADFGSGQDYRVIQFTPPGSGCSIIFGKDVTAAAPGSAQGLYLIVSDIEAARKELLGLGVEISRAFHDANGVYDGPDEPYLFGRRRVSGPDPDHRSYRSYASFRDPDGNGWLLQEVTTRLPGRIDSTTTNFASVSDLASALRRAEAAHGQHEKRTGQRDANWPDWYAAYMVAEQAGGELPQ